MLTILLVVNYLFYKYFVNIREQRVYPTAKLHDRIGIYYYKSCQSNCSMDYTNGILSYLCIGGNGHHLDTGMT